MASALAPTFVLRGHAASVTALTFPIKNNDTNSQDNNEHLTLVSGDGQGLVKFWNLHDRRCILTLDPDQQAIKQTEQLSFKTDPALSILALICRDDLLIVQRKDGRIVFLSVSWQSIHSKDPLIHQKSVQHLWHIETGAFSFFRMSLCSTKLIDQSSLPTNNLLIVATNPPSNLHIIDIEQRKSICLVECETRTKDPLKSIPELRVNESNVLDLSRITSLFPYDRKHGMCMAASLYYVTKTSDNGTENQLHLAVAAESGSVLLIDIDLAHRRSNVLRELKLTGGDPLISIALCLDRSENDNHQTIDVSGVTAGTDLAVRPFVICEPISSTTLPDLVALPEVPLATTQAHNGVNALIFVNNGSRLAVAGWDHRTRLFRCDNFAVHSHSGDDAQNCNRQLVPESLLKCHTKSVQSLAYHDALPSSSSRALISVPSSSTLARYARSARQAEALTPSSWLVTGGEDAHIAVYSLK